MTGKPFEICTCMADLLGPEKGCHCAGPVLTSDAMRHWMADAQRAELHLDLPDDDLRELAMHADYGTAAIA